MAARVICNGGRGLGTRVSHISAVEGARVVAAESRNLAASRQKSSDPQAGHTSTARLVAVRHAAGPHVDVARPPKGVSVSLIVQPPFHRGHIRLPAVSQTAAPPRHSHKTAESSTPIRLD